MNFKFTPFRIGAGLAVMLLVCILGLYCSSSSKVSVPKADEYGINANVHHDASVNAEADAANIRARVDEIEKDRQTEGRVYTERTRQAQRSRGDLDRQRKDYEKVRSTKPVGGGDDLDARERQLLADLETLYDRQ